MLPALIVQKEATHISVILFATNLQLMQVDYPCMSYASTIPYTRPTGLVLPSSASECLRQLKRLFIKHAQSLGMLSITGNYVESD
jgi:hypothetical protein